MPLEQPTPTHPGRRDFLKKGAVAGAVAWTVPVIASTPAWAQASLLGSLYAISGDGSTTPSTIYTVDTTTAALTTLITPPNTSDDGEVLAADGSLLYRLSGFTTSHEFQSIDPAIPSATDIADPGAISEVTSFVWDATAGVFKLHNLGGEFYELTTAGVATLLNAAPTGLTLRVRGMGFQGSTLWAVASNASILQSIDPTTGSATGTVAVTVGGNPIQGANALTVDPATDVAYLVYRTAGTRRLGTVDTTTGIITDIGLLSENVSGLAWL